jgi:hypothetical protein
MELTDKLFGLTCELFTKTPEELWEEVARHKVGFNLERALQTCDEFQITHTTRSVARTLCEFLDELPDPDEKCDFLALYISRWIESET